MPSLGNNSIYIWWRLLHCKFKIIVAVCKEYTWSKLTDTFRMHLKKERNLQTHDMYCFKVLMLHSKEPAFQKVGQIRFLFLVYNVVWNGLVMVVIALPMDLRLRLECDKRGCTPLLNSKMPPATSKPILVNFISNPLVICHCLWILQSIFSIKMSSCLLNSFIPLAFMTFL